MHLDSISNAFPSSPLRPFKTLLAAFRRQVPEQPKMEDENAARRDFILDKLNENPEAFHSELDVQNMMYVYPARF